MCEEHGFDPTEEELDFITIVDEDGKETKLFVEDEFELEEVTYIVATDLDENGDPKEYPLGEEEYVVLKRITPEGSEQEIVVTVDDQDEAEKVLDYMFELQDDECDMDCENCDIKDECEEEDEDSDTCYECGEPIEDCTCDEEETCCNCEQPLDECTCDDE